MKFNKKEYRQSLQDIFEIYQLLAFSSRLDIRMNAKSRTELLTHVYELENRVIKFRKDLERLCEKKEV